MPKLNPSLKKYVDFLGVGFWKTVGLSEQKQGDLSVQVDISGLNDTSSQKVAAKHAMTVWSSMLPIHFEKVEKGAADIIFDNDSQSAGFTPFTKVLDVDKNFYGGAGFGTGNFEKGGYGFQTYLHEIGHALGLGHGGDYNGVGDFSTAAQFTHDSWKHSVMSYFDPEEAGHANNSYYLTSPRAADLDALIRKYFSHTQHDGSRHYDEVGMHQGDNTYGFGGNQGFQLTRQGNLHDVGFTIHDTGGHDTLNFSGSTSKTILDLTPGAFSSVNGNKHNIDIYKGHNADVSDYYIEKAIGSDFNDRIRGNDGNNELIGGKGSDRITGGGGADQLTGGKGKDLFIFKDPADSAMRYDSKHGVWDLVVDTIMDFTPGEDRIDVSSMDANARTKATNEAFEFAGKGWGYVPGKIGYLQFKEGTLAYGSTEQDPGTPEWGVFLAGVRDPLHEQDFIV